MGELELKIEQLQKVVAEFKAENDKLIKELKEKGHESALQKEKVDKLNDEVSRLEGEVKKLQTAMNRTSVLAETTEKVKDPEHTKAFKEFLRYGAIDTRYMKKDMASNSSQDGGFLVTDEMSAEIVKKVFESSPMRQIASVQTISTGALEILQDLGEVGSGWVGEQSARPKTDTPQWKEVEIPVHELYAMPAASQTILDDAAINIEAYLAEKIAEKFARDEATAFIAGNGVKKPKGILSYGAGDGFGLIEQVETATSGVTVGDDIINLVYSLKSAYKNNAVFLMQRGTIKILRKLKDANDQYLWAPGLNGNTPSTFLGYPIMEAADMEPHAAGKLAIAFGDFRAGYQIVDRIGIRVIRDVYTAKPNVLFYTTKRVGGGVKNFEAIKLLKVKA